jgi:beta-galactosidase
MNAAQPTDPLPAVPDLIGLNYRGEGIRDTPAYAGLTGITTPPQYQAYHTQFPGKVILSTENSAAVSTRGEFLFPVTDYTSAPVKTGAGGDPVNMYVSAYELYTADFGSSPDKVFTAQDLNLFVGGGFVWSGFDYLGEPTPYSGARCPDLKRIGSTFTNRAGFRICPWRTSCRIGRGPVAKARSRRCTCSPPAMKPNCSLMGFRSDEK